jgi:hypothetical protein
MAHRSRFRVPFVVTIAFGAAACASEQSSEKGEALDSDASVDAGPCPSSKPIPGTACDLPGVSCQYPGALNACGDALVETATCSSGIWYLTIAQSPCDAGHVPCPTEVPSAGDTCDVVPGDLCQYDTGGCCQKGFACVANHWFLIPMDCNPPGLVCPTEVPELGAPCDPCAEIYFFCMWGSCSDGGAAIMGTCDLGAWVTDEVDCTTPVDQ